MKNTKNSNSPHDKIMSLKVETLTAGLYLVAMPIGNLGDISLRALSVLGAADFVLCEDTRVTGKLLAAHGIKNHLQSYNDHNADRQRAGILERIERGAAVALVSDAGAPLVSDPGYKLARDVGARGLMLTTVPGASAVIAALQLSGLPSDKFSFIGFLPSKSHARRTLLTEWRDVPGTLVAFETASRLIAALKDIEAALGGERPMAVVREITKLYEESRRDNVSALLAHYSEHGAPKGEIVLVIGAAAEKEYGEGDIAALLRQALAEGLRVKEAAAQVSAQTGLSKKELYDLALALSKGTTAHKAEDNETDIK